MRHQYYKEYLYSVTDASGNTKYFFNHEDAEELADELNTSVIVKEVNMVKIIK